LFTIEARVWVVAAAAALVGTAACEQVHVGEGEGSAAVDRRLGPIVDGTINTGDPAIVELLALHSPTRAGLCTATLVSPRVFLTAAHCVAENASALFGVFYGASNETLNAQTFVPALAAVAHPAYKLSNPALEHDVAVVVLAAPAPMAPLPMNRQALGAESLGRLARYVGYGLSDGVARTGSGIKRETSQTIAEVQRTYIRIAANPHGACNGDSGGPLLMKRADGREAVIGVVSFGDDEHCLQSSYFQRLDTQLAWVDEQIAKYDPPAAPPPVVAIDGGGASPTVASSDAGVAAETDAGVSSPALPVEPASDAGVTAEPPMPGLEPAPPIESALPPAATDPAAPAMAGGGVAVDPAAAEPAPVGPSSLVLGTAPGCAYAGHGSQQMGTSALLITLLGALIAGRRSRRSHHRRR
jgi:hypothetical protein